MKKIIKLLIFGSMLFNSGLCVSCDSIGAQFKLELLEDNTYSISCNDHINYGDILEIPSTYRGKKISTIKDEGFINKSFSKVFIPYSVIKIGKRAFYNCEHLSDIYYNRCKQSFYCTFNDAPVGFDDSVECGENCFGKLNLPSFSTRDLVTNTQFELKCKNINTLGNKIKYDIGYIDDTDERSQGEFLLDSSEVSTTITAKAHGILKDAKFSIYKDEVEKYRFTSRNIKVSAPEYNICPISGTFPVLLFSLQLKEITKNGTIPTYLALNRPASYDWDKLMYNMKPFPNVSKPKAMIDKWLEIKQFTSEYIKDLYEANNNSIFHLYTKDHCADLPLMCFSSNGIDQSRYTIHFYSDGTLTPVVFNNNFGIEEGKPKFDCDSKIDKMAKDIDNANKYFLQTKKWDANKLVSMLSYPRSLTHEPTNDPMQNYSLAYAMKYANNTSYQTGRLSYKDNIKKVYNNDPEFYKKIVNVCEQMNTYELLKKIDDKESFKEMYKFNDEIFKESEVKGHDMVMILGGSWSIEKNNFYAYTKMTMEYFGHDTVDYYYKPHPGHPTSLTPERNVIITQLNKEGYNIKELDASIAAEVILFFKPTLSAAGWESTTFTSLEEDSDKGLALYDLTKAQAKSRQISSEFFNKFTSFYSVATDEIKEKYLGTKEIDGVYLIEFNDEGKGKAIAEYTKHDIALYLIKQDKFRYFKGEIEVDKEGKPIQL